VTRVWGAARATLYRHRRGDEPAAERRPGPVGPMPDEALVEAIRKLLADSPFHGEGYRKIWARLRFAGIRTSKRRVLRLTREHGLQAPGRVGRPHGSKAHDGTIRTERVDEMWGTDLTSTMTGEGQASIFVTVDHASTECVGIHAARRATRFEALEPLRQSVRACFGAFAERIASGLKLRHDHGSQFVADDFQREVAFLGIESSPAFVREPEGNGCVERFIRTLKENLLWVRRFDTIEDLRLALHAFKDT
jgi:transposase InsO family protein